MSLKGPMRLRGISSPIKRKNNLKIYGHLISFLENKPKGNFIYKRKKGELKKWQQKKKVNNSKQDSPLFD